MKQVIVIIRNEMYFKTKDALQIAGFGSLSVKDVLGRGRRNFKGEIVKNLEESEKEVYMSNMYSKKMLEIYVRDEDVESVIKVILSLNSQGNPGDGKIFVVPVRSALRIRTGETDVDALV